MQEIASRVTEDDLSCGRIYPRLQDIREISVYIAIAIAEHAYNVGRLLLFFCNFRTVFMSNNYQCTLRKFDTTVFCLLAERHCWFVPKTARFGKVCSCLSVQYQVR